MKIKVSLVLRDVYGGDGFMRYIEVEERKLQRRRGTKRTRSDIGVSVESCMDEVQTEKSTKEVHTFRYNGTKKPEIRLGGTHGKLWGALKEGRGVLYNALGDPRFKSPRLMDTIQIQPVWVTLEPLEEMRTESLPQVLNTMGRNSMIVQRFDVLPRCSCEVELIFPDSLEAHVKALLEQLKSMGCLNKRRATVESLSQCA